MLAVHWDSAALPGPGGVLIHTVLSPRPLHASLASLESLPEIYCNVSVRIVTIEDEGEKSVETLGR
jgi:hypothetical protein